MAAAGAKVDVPLPRAVSMPPGSPAPGLRGPRLLGEVRSRFDKAMHFKRQGHDRGEQCGAPAIGACLDQRSQGIPQVDSAVKGPATIGRLLIVRGTGYRRSDRLGGSRGHVKKSSERRRCDGRTQARRWRRQSRMGAMLKSAAPDGLYAGDDDARAPTSSISACTRRCVTIRKKIVPITPIAAVIQRR